jgi:ABC-type transport system involved in cytochrome bd biosynthesis fused ATPase/permease subunit
MMTQASIDETKDNQVSEQAAESTFAEVDDTDRAIPAIEFRNVTMIFDNRKILNDLSFKVMKGETKIILGRLGLWQVNDD